MLKEFSSHIWISIIISIGIVAFSLKMILKLKNENKEEISPFLITFGIYCQQGFHGCVSAISIRCLIIFLYLSGMMVYNFYTSVLVSTLVESKYETNILSVLDLVKSDLSILLSNTNVIRHFQEVLFYYLTKPKRK